MADKRGYDMIVDFDRNEQESTQGQLRDNLEFHESNFNDYASNGRDTSNPGPLFENLPSGENDTSKKAWWSLSFYAQYFDVDTNEVLKRCWAALFPRTNFLDILEGNPDLYGPIWISITVILILFLAGSFSRYLVLKGAEEDVKYDFKLLSGAAGLIYMYTAFVPIGLWLALKWLGSESANLLECLSLYGYANIIWIPVALVSWSSITILNYVFVGLGFASSLTFILRNLYPVLFVTDPKNSKLLLIAVSILHAALGIAIKVLFFAHGSPLSNHS